MSLLSPEKIQQYLLTNNIQLIEVIDKIDSTNAYLLQRIDKFSKMPRVCLAEQQTYGRGRRGRIWHSPYAQNIYLSLLWKFSASRSNFQGLSLVVAIAIAKALEKLHLPKPVSLKWPNDIFIDGKKCAGILIETCSEMHDGAPVVIGVGINVNMRETTEEISQAWTSLSCELQQTLDRNKLAANIIDEIIEHIILFDETGFMPFQSRFEKYDMMLSRDIQVNYDNKIIQGKSRGIDNQGRLILMAKEGRMIINIGNVSLQSANRL